MSDVVISAEGLGKSYLIGHQSERDRYSTLREVVTRSAREFARSATDMMRGRQLVAGDSVEEFWALKDMSFEIKRGEVVGIIGRNGAGKSTLLKVLSRITEPTKGRVTIKGRVASLLEVGTGFHPELTGRENIYLNGAILGMSRAEIRSKFDEIVAFSEVEKFLDTPVKRYSSGMYVRLAFAVAAHLEPEILVVDEVLAVGDAEFQKKCLGKMGEVAGHGRTVLFVSHHMAAVLSLCQTGILLQKGKVIGTGAAAAIVEQYSMSSEYMYEKSFPVKGDKLCISRVKINKSDLVRGNISVEISFSSPGAVRSPIGGVVIKTPLGQPVWGTNGRFHENHPAADYLKNGVLKCTAIGLPLMSGNYTLSVWLGDGVEDFDGHLDIFQFELGAPRSGVTRPSREAIGCIDWPAVWTAH